MTNANRMDRIGLETNDKRNCVWDSCFYIFVSFPFSVQISVYILRIRGKYYYISENVVKFLLLLLCSMHEMELKGGIVKTTNYYSPIDVSLHRACESFERIVLSISEQFSLVFVLLFRSVLQLFLISGN